MCQKMAAGPVVVTTTPRYVFLVNAEAICFVKFKMIDSEL